MAYDDGRLAPISLAKAESVVIKVPATPAIEKCLINSDKEVNGSAIVKMSINRHEVQAIGLDNVKEITLQRTYKINVKAKRSNRLVN